MSFARRILRSSVEAVGTSVAFVILYSVLAGLAGTPARLEEVAHRSAEGMVPLEYLTSALFRDTNVNLVFFIAFWAVIWLALKTHHWMRGESSRRFLFLLIFPFAVLVAIAGFMGSEFKVERGVYPSWFDLNNAQGGTGVGVGYLKLALRPALLAAWAALAFATLLLMARVTKAHLHLDGIDPGHRRGGRLFRSAPVCLDDGVLSAPLHPERQSHGLSSCCVCSKEKAGDYGQLLRGHGPIDRPRCDRDQACRRGLCATRPRSSGPRKT